MDFAQHTGCGFGVHWRGVLFRETYPQLSDVIAKTKRWFPAIFGKQCRFNGGEFTWTFPGGEQLLLRHGRTEDDYWNYHGHEYPWIGFEELTNWPSLGFYESMKACSRSSHPGMPRKFRSTCNPYGVGHNVVKTYFIDPAPPGVVITNSAGEQRVRIHGKMSENITLLKADPDYVNKLKSITDENKRKAWLEGSWDITAGGMFDDIWDRRVHVLAPFTIPRTWYVDRAFDWGSSRPFAVGWFAESDGSPVDQPDGSRMNFPKGTLFLIAEWYGWNGKANEGLGMTSPAIAAGIAERERFMRHKVHAGPADTSIFDVVGGNCIAAEMATQGIGWTKADKSSGSRINGWQRLRTLLSNSLPRGQGKPMEAPGLFVFNTCTQFLRTFPVLSRDEKNMDDVDSDGEDHMGDMIRYRSLNVHAALTVRKLTGT